MKRLLTTFKNGRAEKDGEKYEEEVVIDWEVRPGGMLVQKRGFGSDASGGGPLIKIKVTHDSYHHDLTLPAQSTFGDLKRVLANETGLDPKEQRLLFRGKEKDDYECLHMAGVKDMSKVILLEDPASKERKLEEMKKTQHKAYEAVMKVRAEVDKLSDKVVALERAMKNSIKVEGKEFLVLTELLMVQLLQLDSIEADGETRVQRRIEVHRVQSFVDALDNMKAQNSNCFINRSNIAVPVSTKWETFDSGVGSLSAPNMLRSTKITQDWEPFD